MLSFVTKYPCTLVMATTIVILSLIPTPEVPPEIEVPLMDKWVHMLMYATLCIIIWAEYWHRHDHINTINHIKSNLLNLAVGAILCPLALGGAMELLQAYATTCRSGDWLDFAANSIGVAIGTVAGLALGGIVKPKENDQTDESVLTNRY